MCTQLFDLMQAIQLDLTFHGDRPLGVPLPLLGGRETLRDDLSRWDPLPSDAHTAAVISLLKALPKKFVGSECESVTEADRNDKAKALFLDANDRCRITNERLRSMTNRISSTSHLDDFTLQVLGEAQRFVHDLLLWEDDSGFVSSNVPMRDMLSSLRCGPGASAGVSGCSFIHKTLCGPLTMTSAELYRWYLLSLSTAGKLTFEDGSPRSTYADPDLLAAEKARFEVFGNAIVEGSVLSFAPKKWDISRTIATEPSLNMMFQLALHSVLVRFLKRAGIDLERQQEVNKSLARLGSSTGQVFTLDGKSASDLNSIELVRWLFPPDWFGWFMSTRSPSVAIDGVNVPLNMISSMGNGYTFALETVVFLALTVATCRVQRIPYHLPSRRMTGNVGVYGDDIIGPSEAFSAVAMVLEDCGFIVNHDKSYSTGCFRESCGGDYYAGTDIRGIYASSLSTPQDRVSLANRLIEWGGKHGFHFPLTVEMLLRGDLLVVVPLWDDVESGLRVPYRTMCRVSRLARRKSTEPTHRVVTVDGSPKIVSSGKMNSPTAGQIGYNSYRFKPSKIPVLKGSADDLRCEVKGFMLLDLAPVRKLAYLQGTLRDRWLTLRSDEATYEIMHAYVTNWDIKWAGSFRTKSEREEFCRFEHAAYMSSRWITSYFT